LGELRLGAWEGKTFEELSRSEEWMRYNNWRSGVRPPEGESMLETQTRIVNELQCLALQHSSQRVAVVSHADPIRAALAHYLGIPLDLTVRFEISPASVSVVEVGSEPPHVLCVNGAGDLAL
jgi:broad specificity phosphatase PhoE